MHPMFAELVLSRLVLGRRAARREAQRRAAAGLILIAAGAWLATDRQPCSSHSSCPPAPAPGTPTPGPLPVPGRTQPATTR